MTERMTSKEFREMQPTLPGTRHVTSANLGKEFETMLKKTHSEYAAQRAAQVDKNPLQWDYTNEFQYKKFVNEPVEFVAKTNKGNLLIKSKSNIDFSGVIAPTGRAVHFDAKQFKGKSFSFNNLKRHQLDTLLGKEQLGAIAGLMLYFSELHRVFFVSAKILDAAFVEMLYKNGRKSFSLAQCESEGIEITVKSYFVDWLEKLK